MRVYFEKMAQQGLISNINFYSALEGFIHMGFHPIEVKDAQQIPTDDLESVALGSINYIQKTLRRLDKIYPIDLDYPSTLNKFLGRKLKASTINEFDVDTNSWNMFIKPRGQSKKFTGRVVQNLADLRGTADQQYNVPIWISETVDFVREWRVFVRYGKILDVRPYKGKWQIAYNAATVEAAVAAFTDAPNGYGMDIGVTKDGQTLLVEVNDGYSLGSYGLYFIDYAKLLSARWAQLTNTHDLCAFDL